MPQIIYGAFIVQIVALYFISRYSLQQLYRTLSHILVSKKLVYVFISLIFFPGTLIHELAHFIVAAGCLLRIRDLRLFPEFEENGIKLGSVHYERKDFVRGLLVGVAPVFAALGVFALIHASELFPSQNILITIVISYFIFAISSTMFSSRQDLVDLFYLFPLGIIIAGIVYVFQINLGLFFGNAWVLDFFKTVDQYLFFSIVIHIIAVLLMRGVQLIFINR